MSARLQHLGIWAIEHLGLFEWSCQKPQSTGIADDSASKAVAAFGRFLFYRRGPHPVATGQAFDRVAEKARNQSLRDSIWASGHRSIRAGDDVLFAQMPIHPDAQLLRRSRGFVPKFVDMLREASEHLGIRAFKHLSN